MNSYMSFFRIRHISRISLNVFLWKSFWDSLWKSFGFLSGNPSEIYHVILSGIPHGNPSEISPGNPPEIPTRNPCGFALVNFSGIPFEILTKISPHLEFFVAFFGIPPGGPLPLHVTTLTWRILKFCLKLKALSNSFHLIYVPQTLLLCTVTAPNSVHLR